MSEVASELARVRGAFRQPTLTLLHQRQAPVVIAVFRAAFGRDNRPVPTARLHAQVEDHLGRLRGAGEPDVPVGSGREVCLRWMRGQWLVRTLDDSGREVYALTSHAQQALELVKALSRDRATLSEHRIATLLSTVRRFNSEANPDRTARVTLLNAEIARLTAERDRLVDGAELEPATPDYMLEGFTELQLLISALPSDFARVEERFAQIRAEILASFRSEARPAGEVIDDYLARADALMTATPEGRAFEGAFALLRDDSMVGQLRDDLAALLEHPLSDQLLADGERAELRGTVRLIREGLDRVLSQRSRVTSTLKEYIVSHDATRDRELEQTLRRIESELMTWMAHSGPRATVDLPLLPARVEVEHLRERFHDPADDVVPTRLADLAPPETAGPSRQDLMALGGPSLADLRERLDRAMGSPDPAASLGDLFDSLDPSLRRPVEILGLLHLAADRDLAAEERTEPYRAVRPDGSQRTFRVPLVPLPGTDPSAPDLDRTPQEDAR
ncbi:DUF3375 domain-containing protein [Nocardioides campestrisoli]|uniref:DUF3375 domain-containing protein n=1 Tax=Nocardioides campestrisoli TaxID=2736757 RepID=UPI00163DCAEF|nr:DUF3375 domain-containing protein [Nocardioides campestrisoli]